MGSISIGDTHGNDHANSATSRVSRLHGDDSRVPRQWGLRQRDDSGSVIPKEPMVLPHTSGECSDHLQPTFRIIAEMRTPSKGAGKRDACGGATRY